MTRDAPKSTFAARPQTADAWVRARTPDAPNPHTARLTVDVTPAQRTRIKLTAFTRGVTVAEMLRTLLEREYPAAPEDPR